MLRQKQRIEAYNCRRNGKDRQQCQIFAENDAFHMDRRRQEHLIRLISLFLCQHTHRQDRNGDQEHKGCIADGIADLRISLLNIDRGKINA